MIDKLDELHAHWDAQMVDMGYSTTANDQGVAAQKTAKGGGNGGGTGAATVRVVSFVHAFGRDLSEAREWVAAFKESGLLRHVNQAWDLYSTAFRRIKKQISNVETLELQHVSPKLLAARDFELAVSLASSVLGRLPSSYILSYQ